MHTETHRIPTGVDERVSPEHTVTQSHKDTPSHSHINTHIHTHTQYTHTQYTHSDPPHPPPRLRTRAPGPVCPLTGSTPWIYLGIYLGI